MPGFGHSFGNVDTSGWHADSSKSAGNGTPPGIGQAIVNRAVAAKNKAVSTGQGSVGNSAVSVLSGGMNQNSSSGLGSDWNNYMDMLKAVTDQNNQFNLEQTKMVNDFNALEAQKNRDWQERLSNTAHQREVADLIAAGLNPVLSAGGVGAVTPSGSAASGQKAVADNTVSQGLVSMIQSAIYAASAERVAQINAASNAYAANAYAGASRYGSDLNYSAQMSYQKTISNTSGLRNLTSLASSLIGKLL